MKRNFFHVSRSTLLTGSAMATLLMAPLVSLGAGPDSTPASFPPNSPPAQAPSSMMTEPHSHPMEVTWHALDSFEQVNSASALVVHAKVISQRRGMMRTYGWNVQENRFKTPQEAGNEFTDTPLTISMLSVTELVRGGPQAVALGGRPVSQGSVIELVELGGYLTDGCFTEPSDKPVLRTAEEGVFFLSPTERPGVYNVVGGWEGRMSVREGKIHALANDTHPGAQQFTRYTGRDLASFIDEVRRMPVQPQ
jgi:hypothetical protein